ncbi:MAG: hypothetical protein K0U52_09470 [Gammaproteobacteria bacterium]|nr:hypothetical protein [Gammaproteobacteria bacterium]
MNNQLSPKVANPKEILRAKLREKIGIKQLSRSTKKQKKHVLKTEFDKLGVDYEEFKSALKTVKMEKELEKRLSNVK